MTSLWTSWYHIKIILFAKTKNSWIKNWLIDAFNSTNLDVWYFTNSLLNFLIIANCLKYWSRAFEVWCCYLVRAFHDDFTVKIYSWNHCFLAKNEQTLVSTEELFVSYEVSNFCQLICRGQNDNFTSMSFFQLIFTWGYLLGT